MIILIDHYDSFSAILADYFKQLHCDILIIPTDKISLEKIKLLNPSHIIIGPGPGHPDDRALTDVYRLIKYYHTKIPLLGVCLGHQILARFFGAHIIPLPLVHHGLVSRLDNHSGVLFKGISGMSVTRYHSLMISANSLPLDIKIIAECTDIDSKNKVIMAIEHIDCPVYGVQFHPEAVLTEFGLKLLKNFLTLNH